MTSTVVCLIAANLLTFGARSARGAEAKHPDRHAVVERLQTGLRGFPLRRYAYALEAAGHRYRVSPYFLASIAGVESTFGKAACGGNAWGIASCGMSFADFREGAFYTAKLLRERYIDRGLRTPYSIGRVYCPPCGDGWGQKVSFFMRHFFRSGPGVTYP